MVEMGFRLLNSVHDSSATNPLTALDNSASIFGEIENVDPNLGHQQSITRPLCVVA